MNTNIVIQPIENHQLDALSTFAAAEFTRVFGHLYERQHLDDHLVEKYSAAFFTAELARGCKILVALDDGKLIGYIKYGPMGLPIEHEPDSMEIHRLYVHPDQQGAGIGRKLAEKALSDMSDDIDIYLGVWSENHQAQVFYQRFGFEKVGDYDYIVGPHRDHEFIFRRGKETA